MLDFYFWPTPNGWKVSILLEELGIEYNTIPVNIGKGDQFKPEFILGDEYTIVDMINWPWVLIAKPLGQSLDDFPNVARWRKAVKDRPAVQRGVDLGKEFRRAAPPSDEERKILFGQTSKSAEAAS
jgi:glutathione S-transferase